MKTYISILRGINVSGHRLIKMDALRKMYEGLGFQNTTTYLQSGNVIFRHKTTKPEILAQTISRQIQKDFDYDVPVLVLSTETLKKIIDNNPFGSNKDNTFLYTTFLFSSPGKYENDAISAKQMKDEEIVITDKVVYLYCPGGYGKSKLSNHFIETKLKVVATTRNWKTTNELLKIGLQSS